MTDVCPGGKKKWTTELAKCKQAQDDKLCSSADTCADLPDEKLKYVVIVLQLEKLCL